MFTEPTGYQPLYPVNVVASTYSDETVIVRLSNKYSCPNAPNIFAIRIIYQNGTTSGFNLANFTFPELNFCPIDRIDIFSLPGVQLGSPISLENINKFQTRLVTSKFTSNSNEIILSAIFNQSVIQWIKLDWDSKSQKLNKNSDGEITPTNEEQIDDLELFSTIGGGYGILFSTSLKIQSTFPTNPTSFDSFTKPQSLIYFSKILPNQIKSTNSTLVYHNAIPQTRLVIGSCQASLNGNIGNKCSVNGGNSVLKKDFWLIISFYSTGSVKEYKDLPGFQVVYKESLPYHVKFNQSFGLYSGDFLMTGAISATNNITGTIYDENGNFIKEWGLPSLEGYNFDILKNNTVVATLPEQDNSGKSWYIYTTDDLSSSLVKHNDNIYKNLNIKSTFPPINSTIPLRTASINITFQGPVALSNLLRQIFDGTSAYCKTSKDGLLVTIDVFLSTFNQPQSEYYVQVDGNFVKDKSFDEPLLESINILLSLTPIATLEFESFTDNQIIEYFTNLTLALSGSIPIEVERFKINPKWQYDGMKEPKQILFSMEILSTSNLSEPNSKQVFNDFETMLKLKNQTKLIQYGSINWLDENHGVVIIRYIWEEYRYQIAGFICALFMLCVLGNNMALFKFILIMADFTLDILFIIYNGKDVPRLFFPSKDNKFITILFMIFGYVDLVSLELFDSKSANQKIFQANFTPIAKNLIYIGSLIGLMIEDAAQLTIQVKHMIVFVVLEKDRGIDHNPIN
ncbi:14651_t:CDS:10 [Entrophospora sp. SA101]|nr:14651_t:CDS:10 [Entrophospora sp. SA101]